MKKNINHLLKFEADFDVYDEHGALCFKKGGVYTPTNMKRGDANEIEPKQCLRITFINEEKRNHTVTSVGWLKLFHLV